MTSKMLARTFIWINQNLLRVSKQKTGQRVQLLSIGNAVLKQTLRAIRKVPLKLEPPNQKINFPLTNRWSNPNPRRSQQEISMVVKQVGLTLKNARIFQKDLINARPDKCKQSINVMGLYSTSSYDQVKQVERIMGKYGTYLFQTYNFQREILYAESHINGQHSFNLRKYHKNPKYELSESKNVEQQYRNQLKKAFDTEKPNLKNLQAAGITYEQLKNRILVTGEGVYEMLFEDLQKLTGGDILPNTPTIYLENIEIKDTYYLQCPYPIYVKVNGKFICAAIGFRYEKGSKVRIFSPFFESQNENVWRLAQSHLSQAIFNDFHMRIHLGVYHFTTNQYNVPMYNYLNGLSKQNKQKYQNFLDYTYSLFNRGLEGVNVSGIASLVHPIPQYSLINRTFNLTQQNAVKLIAWFSNRVDLRTYSPAQILERNGISKQIADKQLDRLSLDIELYSIISKYIDSVYEIFEINSISDGLIAEITKQLKNMGVGGTAHRPGIDNSEDLKKLLKNIMFCWVGYHAHTFATIVLGNYWHFRPSIVKKPLPYNSAQWKNIIIGQQIPDTKIIMQGGKLIQTTTQRQTNNQLLVVFRTLALKAHCLKQGYQKKHKPNSQKYAKLQKALNQTLKDLDKYGERVHKLNGNRGDSISLSWMHPERMQTSLNI